MKQVRLLSILMIPYLSTTTSQALTTPPLDFISLTKKVYKKTRYIDEETLWNYYQSPLDLNQAIEQELASLGILSKAQIVHFFNYKTQAGPLLSIYELQAIPTWDLSTIALLQPFVKVEKTSVGSKQNPSYKQSITLCGQGTLGKVTKKQKKGAATKPLGDPYKLFFNYKRSQAEKYSIGIIGRKDPKEPFIYNLNQPHWGYWAGHMMLEDRKFLKKGIIGNYQVGFGQGLIMGKGFSMDKNAEAVYILKAHHKGIKPTTSYARKQGFQGVGVALQKKNCMLTLYRSKRRLDAELYKPGTDSQFVTSITDRGVPYDSVENAEKKGKIQEKIIGTALVYTPKDATFELGVQAVKYQYSESIIPKGNYYNAEFFKGKDGGNIGAFYHGIWHNSHFFGEVGVSQNKGKGALAGTMISLGKLADLAILVRHYDANFHTIYGRAFGRNTENRNEQGLYLGGRLYPIQRMCLTSYIDFFRHPKPKHRAHIAIQGREWLVGGKYQFSRTALLQLTLKNNCQPYNRSKTKKQKGSTKKRPKLDLHENYKLKLKLDYLLKDALRGRTQVQGTRFQLGDGKCQYGLGLVQNFYYKNKKVDLKAHIGIFRAKYNTRLYFYENSIVPSFNYPALYGKGIRTGASVRYKFTRRLSLELEWVFTYNKRPNTGTINNSHAIRWKLVYK